MQTIHNFLNEINQNNSSNYKLSILKKYQNDQNVIKLLSYTYNKVNYNFYINGNRVLKEVSKISDSFGSKYTLDNMYELLDQLQNGLRGNQALFSCISMYEGLDEANRNIFINILNRDLKLNINYKQINKIFKNLIPKPQYSRCDIYNDKNASKIDYPAFIELKVDGTYREFLVQDGKVFGRTRSGEEYFNEILENELKLFKDGYYFGELIINDNNNRMENNGLINSDNPPNDKIDFIVWDYLTVDEYQNLKNQRYYRERLLSFEQQYQNLKNNVKHIQLIEYHIVYDKKQTLKYVSDWMNRGLEGGVLKDFKYIFKNGTSKQQLKIKLKVDADLRIVGFTDGTIGTKREGKIGAIQYANDEGTVKGQCSGFNDDLLDYFTEHKNDLIGKIITVEFCDITKSQNNNYYALMHPRFKEIRNDKIETDDLQRIIEMRDMARNL